MDSVYILYGERCYILQNKETQIGKESIYENNKEL